MFTENNIGTQEIAENVKKAVRVEDIVTVGGLPAGPSLEESDAIIVVEGRADVLKLLSCGIKNSIAVEGTSVPKFVADLTKRKTVTAFTDGDRGGELIIKELLQVGDIDYIAQAPDGKSVEDLTQKEVFKSLRNKVQTAQYVETMNLKKRGRGGRRASADRQVKKQAAKSVSSVKPASSKGEEASRKSLLPKRKTLTKKPLSRKVSRSSSRREPEKTERIAPRREVAKKVIQPARPNPYQDRIKELAGTLTAKLLGEDDSEIETVAVRDIANTIKNVNNEVKGVVFDGVITQRLLDIAAEKELDFIAGVKLGNVVKQPTNIRVLTLQ
jgi:DNA primase